MDAVNAIFDVLGEAGTAIGEFLASAFNAVVGIFYTPGTAAVLGDSGQVVTAATNGQISFLGVVLLISLAFAVLWYCFHFIVRLVKGIRAK